VVLRNILRLYAGIDFLFVLFAFRFLPVCLERNRGEEEKSD